VAIPKYSRNISRNARLNVLEWGRWESYHRCTPSERLIPEGIAAARRGARTVQRWNASRVCWFTAGHQQRGQVFAFTELTPAEQPPEDLKRSLKHLSGGRAVTVRKIPAMTARPPSWLYWLVAEVRRRHPQRDLGLAVPQQLPAMKCGRRFPGREQDRVHLERSGQVNSDILSDRSTRSPRCA
jgi:hypothetical protein